MRFLDDSMENVEAAKALGTDARLVRDRREIHDAFAGRDLPTRLGAGR